MSIAVLYVLILACATVVLVRGKIFLGPKAFVLDRVTGICHFVLKGLFGCSLCLGFWAGVVGYFVMDGTWIGYGWLGIPASGVIVSVAAKILDSLAYENNRTLLRVECPLPPG